MRLRLEWDRPGRPPSTARMTAALLVGVTPDARPAGGHDVCLLLDTSKSMEGEKLRRAIDACRLALEALGPEDRLAVCTYATEVRQLVGLAPVSGTSPADLMASLAPVTAAGCTLTHAALEQAAALFAAREDPSRPATLLLVTDGHPTDQRGRLLADTAPVAALAEAPGLRGVSISPVGLGSGDDFDTGFLESLADRGRGTFCHAEDPATLGVLLRDRLRRARDTVLSEAALTVEPLGVSARVEAACRVTPDYVDISVPPLVEGRAELALGPLTGTMESLYMLRVSTAGQFGTDGPQPVVRIAARAGTERAEATAELLFTGAPREQQRVNEEANRCRLAWELAYYQRLVNVSDDAGRTGDLLERIRTTGELIGNTGVVDDAQARLMELRATGAISGNANARATARLRGTGELVASSSGPNPETVVTAPASDGAPAPTEGTDRMAGLPGGGIGFGGGETRTPDPEPWPADPERAPLRQETAGLTVRVGAKPEITYPLSGREIVLGRDAPGVEVDLDLSGQEAGDRYTVSRRHALISWEDGGCMIRDLGSKAGTIVNGRPLTAPSGGSPAEALELHAGDRVTLGSVELEVTQDA